jgi:hypothetical protein
MGRQSDAPFRFLVRPVTTVNITGKKLSWAFEDELFSSFEAVTFSSPITGILILPGIIDGSIVVIPPDHVGYNKADNSVSVGRNIDFELWQHSSESERLELLVENIHASLDQIQVRYLIDEDRRRLHELIDKAHIQLARRLQASNLQ